MPLSPPSDPPSLSFVFYMGVEGGRCSKICLPSLHCTKEGKEEGEEEEKGEEEERKEGKTFTGLSSSFSSSIMCSYMCYMSKREAGTRKGSEFVGGWNLLFLFMHGHAFGRAAAAGAAARERRGRREHLI